MCRISMLCLIIPLIILRALLRLRVVACSSHELIATAGSKKPILLTANQLHLLDSDAVPGDAAYDILDGC